MGMNPVPTPTIKRQNPNPAACNCADCKREFFWLDTNVQVQHCPFCGKEQQKPNWRYVDAADDLITRYRRG